MPQSSCGTCDCRSARTKQFRKDILGNRKVLRTQAVLHHEQPSSDALINFMVAITRRQLLQDEATPLHVRKHHRSQRPIFRELKLQLTEPATDCPALNLHHGSCRRSRLTQKMSRFNKSLSPNRKDFDAIAALKRIDDGNGSRKNEVRVSRNSSRFEKYR
ncbi:MULTISPECIES: hypothetical protein [Terriglobus]|nr:MULTISPECIES: hypothetical protein [Terriglobus]